jgi:hypothetical protein
MSLWVEMSLSVDRAMNKPCNFPESESEINIIIKRNGRMEINSEKKMKTKK